MSVPDLIFGRKPAPPPSEAVLITLRGTFADAGGELADFANFEDQLIEAVEGSGAGEFDGNEVGEGEATIFLHGSDAERLYSAVESLIRSSQICNGASIIIRQGGPGSPQRVIQL